MMGDTYTICARCNSLPCRCTSAPVVWITYGSAAPPMVWCGVHHAHGPHFWTGGSNGTYQNCPGSTCTCGDDPGAVAVFT